MTTRNSIRKLLLALFAVIVAPQVQAVTTLVAQLVDVSCSLSGPGGAQSVSCQTFSSSAFSERVGFTPFLAPGQTAQVEGFVEYSYSDDGLPLDLPQAFQMDSNGFSWLWTDHEAAALYIGSNNCTGNRYCAPEPEIYRWGDTGFPPLLLGLNDAPDRLNGRVPVSGGLSVGEAHPMGSRQDVYVSWSAISYAGIAPIPESPAWMVLPFGLLALAVRMRRRARAPETRCR